MQQHKGIDRATHQADCEANVRMTEPLPARRQRDGNREAIVRQVFDMRRYTREEHERGDAAGWRLEAGWFRRMGGLEWAWFRREVEDGKT